MSVPDGYPPATGVGGQQPPPHWGPPPPGGSGPTSASPYPAPGYRQGLDSAGSGPGYAGPRAEFGPAPGQAAPVSVTSTVSPAQPSGRPGALDPARLLGLAVAVLGVLNFCFGFLPEVSAPRLDETLSVFAVGPAYVPILLLIAGLLALAAFLPGSERSRLAVAAVSVGGAAGAIVSLGTPGSFELFANPNQVATGMGAILLVIFGIVQAVVAIAAYVVGSDTPWNAHRRQGGYAGDGSTAAGGVAAHPVAVPVPWADHRAGYPAAGQPANVSGSGAQPGTAQPGSGYPGSAQPVSGYPGQAAPWQGQVPGQGPGRPDIGPTAAGWVPLPSRPGQWQPAVDPATGPQVVVGTESVGPNRSAGAADALSSNDTGPIPVVQPMDSADRPGESAHRTLSRESVQAAGNPSDGETVAVTVPKPESKS